MCKNLTNIFLFLSLSLSLSLSLFAHRGRKPQGSWWWNCWRIRRSLGLGRICILCGCCWVLHYWLCDGFQVYVVGISVWWFPQNWSVSIWTWSNCIKENGSCCHSTVVMRSMVSKRELLQPCEELKFDERERERERDVEFGMRGWGERRKLLQPCEELKSDERERERERETRGWGKRRKRSSYQQISLAMVKKWGESFASAMVAQEGEREWNNKKITFFF